MRQPIEIVFNLKTIQSMTDMSMDGVYLAKHRNEFDPAIPASLVVWLAKKGSKKLRRAMMEYSWGDTPENPLVTRERKRAVKKKAKEEKAE